MESKMVVAYLRSKLYRLVQSYQRSEVSPAFYVLEFTRIQRSLIAAQGN